MKKTILIIVPLAVCAIGAIGFCGNKETGRKSPFTIKKIELKQKPSSAETADLNGDKIPDMVIANAEDSSVTILLGIGGGRFTEGKGSPFPAGSTPNDIAIADFNKDGKPDLSFANHTKKYLTVLLGDGKGGFSPMPGSPFHVDVSPHTHGIAVADFNKDGNLDLLTDSWGNNQLAILFGNGHGGFSNVVKYINVGKHPYQRARIGDFNRDGNPDIVTTNLDGNNATILLGDGKGSFREAPGSPVSCGDSPFGVAIGDVNGDHNPDLAIVNSPTITASNTGRDGLTILLGDGKGGFTPMPGSPFKTGTSPSRLAIGDINGDGIADIVVTNYKSRSVTVFMMGGNTVAASYTAPVGDKPDGAVIADMSGSGKGDIVVTNSGSNYINIISMK